MTSLLHLNKFLFALVLLIVFTYNFSFAEDKPEDIWEQKENIDEQNDQISIDKSTTIENSVILNDVSKVVIKINENEINNEGQSVIGIFDPEENNFSLNMWTDTDGKEIKKTIERINKLELSKLSEELLFQVLFTNAYPPKVNLSSEEFLKIKINWLIKKKRIKDLETLLKKNPEVGQNASAIKFLINEYLSTADIKSACDKIDFIDRGVQNSYLDKFTIYCLINNDRKEEAQIILDLLKERDFKDKFFEDKINFLLGITETTNQKILDNNLLNFYISHITSDNFEYEPSDNTDKYIWRYLSSANLMQINNIDDEDLIIKYEKAAAQNSFQHEEVFKIYLSINFNFNQLVNAQEIYKILPNYKARALIYQSILLSDSVEKKIDLAFLLKDLFIKDKLLNVYAEELSNILKSIDADKISEDYKELVNKNLDKKLNSNIKFDNDILHRSKVIRHFLENNVKLSRTEKDLKAVYKKMKRNKNYFISIKDIVVLESLVADGVSIPEDLDHNTLSSQLTVPSNLQELASKNQIGMVMLKIVEIIGEDNINDLDPETVYFLNRILNDLSIKKIRNNILSEALPARV